MKYIYSIIIVLLSIAANAQQDILLTNFNVNSLFLNPAYAGNNGYKQGSLFLNYRDQWLGLEGSPKTLMIGGEQNLFNDRIGLGGSLSRESIGIDTRTDLLGNVAYRLQLRDNTEFLSFGMRVGFHLFSSDFNAINYTGSQDLVYDGQNDQFNVLTVGTGVYYKNRNSYVGLSIPAITAVSQSSAPFKSKHYYLHAGSKFFFNDFGDLALEPTLLLKYEKAAPLQYSIGAKMWLLKQFGIGALYRSEDGIGISCHLNLADNLDFGASYDFNTSELNQDNVGSVEVFVGYRINNDDNDPFR